MDVFEIPVVRHFQKGRACYTGHMTAAESAALTFADHHPPSPGQGRLGYQRPPDQKRGKAFGDYLKTNEAGFMTPLLLNARGGVEFRALPDRPNVGHILVRRDQRIAKIDGQHRGIGVEEHLGDPGYPVPFLMFDDLDPSLEQRLFIDINKEQKKVSMSHVLALGDDELADMVKRLESDPESPWYEKVNLIGARGLGRPVNMQSLRAGLEDLLRAGPVKQLSIEERYQVAKTFWHTVARTWPEAWGNPRKHLLTKSIGMIAVSELGGDLIPMCLTGRGGSEASVLDESKLEEFLSRAGDFDWSSGGELQGIAGRGGAKIVKDRLDARIFPA
ncbi:MAG: DGQHR domain-containing protein [Dehalococcoidia bacterium]|nr:DGQHR domain-containing protein [Dehalococcoidia bacterium]